MINKDELIFVVDQNNIPIKALTRIVAHENNLWHRVTHIWILNYKNEILVQKRSILKDNNPGKWEAFFGGHVAEGQECIDNAVIELEEELGLKVDKKLLHFLYFNKNISTHHFQAVSYVFLDNHTQNMIIEKEEVEEIRWIKIKDLTKILLVEKNQDWVHVEYQEKILNTLKKIKR